MTNQEFQDELVEEMRVFFGSDVIDDPKKLCQFINQKVGPKIDSAKNKAGVEAFEKLDNIAGDIPIFALGDNLSNDLKKNRVLYFVQETMEFLGPLLQIITRVMDFSKLKISVENKEILKLFRISNSVLVNAYVREWETQYSLFVEPTYKKLLDKNLVPKRPRDNDEGRAFLIRVLKEFFEKDNDLKPLISIMDLLNTALRNSIVHLDFYIDDEENRLYYYNRRHDPNEIFIEINELCEIIGQLYIIRILTGIIICRKMV